MHAGADYGSPIPRDEALAENPPVGAVLDYYLKSNSSGPLVIEILDASGQLARRYSSDDKHPAVKPATLEFPAFWRPAPESLSTAPGMHRWIWDLRYMATEDENVSGDDEFPRPQQGVTALPGAYTVKLTVDGKSYSQPLMVKMDPRITIAIADLQKQFAGASAVSRRQSEIRVARRSVHRLLSQAHKLRSELHGNDALAAKLDEFIQAAQDIEGTPQNRFAPVEESRPPKEKPDLTSLNGKFRQIFSAINGGDAAPTADAMRAFATAQAELASVMAQWTAVKTKQLPELNIQIKNAGLAAIVANNGAPVAEG
jgi:hypothetical protein